MSDNHEHPHTKSADQPTLKTELQSPGAANTHQSDGGASRADQSERGAFSADRTERSAFSADRTESGDLNADQSYWRSLEQWSQDPGFREKVETEFKSSPLRGESEDGWARREFLTLMGASLAMSAAGCIRRPVQKIVPYNKQPEEVTFGIDNFYTSTWFDGANGMGILVRTREGRPLKVEGNPKNPLNSNGLSARAQAHILSLYDPERFRSARKNIQNKDKGKERSNRDTVTIKWDKADDEIVAELKKGGVALLTGDLPSPTTRALINDFTQAFPGQHYSWEPISNEEVRLGQKESYGTDVIPQYRIDKAKVIVSVDADFLGTWLASTTYARQFAAGRKDIKKMSKLVVFDSNYSLTGANADVRVRIKPSLQLHVVMGLAYEIIVNKKATKYAGNDAISKVLASFSGSAKKLGVESALWSRLADDLIANKGQSLILAGGLATRTDNSIELQLAVNFLNSALENEGATVNGAQAHTGFKSSHQDLVKLISEMEKGNVKTLIMHKVNPVYASPLAAQFIAGLKKVATVITTADRNDETAKYADYVLPDPHTMEAWNDGEFVEGVFSLQQPTIRPLYDTRSFQLSLMTWAFLAEKGPKRLTQFETYYDYLRNYWRTEIFPKHGKGKSFDDFWEGALQEGVVGSLSESKNARALKLESLTKLKAPLSYSEYELVLYPTVAIADGSMANNSWLQELPDPVTKICWDNYACVSLATAEKEKLKEGTLVELKVGKNLIKIPVHIQPGLHDDVIAVAVGYGRTDAGKIANNVGVNAYPLIDMRVNDQICFSGQKVELRNLGGKYLMAVTQDHHSMEGRKIVVEATLKQYLKSEDANNHKHHVWSIWSGHQYNGNKWAMAVDLNSCTGCNACMVACQSENNVPVVGKKYVIEGREMHWLRIDRYYVGNPKNAEMVFQPVMCQQCDNAPCETVCPVLATVHSSEGLNDMVYNRCVGTRYCSNNCPYKVRRFNWFNYAKKIEKPLHLALNPDVTVRARGVMEKCTFCVHRIKSGRVAMKREGRTELKDKEIQTACQQSCPTGALVFGDINDPNSEVSKMVGEKRAYALLEEFGAAPSVRYLTKIRNNDQEHRPGDSSHHSAATQAEGGHGGQS